MNHSTLRIATRQSALALWQTQWVTQLLHEKFPTLSIDWVKITTQGDKQLDVSLAKIGGKGLFLKELEQALLNDQADIAVHSLKDCPMEEDSRLPLVAYLPRATPQDALLTQHGHDLLSLPEGARVGTSSLRRQRALLTLRPDLQCELLRGNVDSRVKKWLNGQYDAIILAACGLERLGLAQHITQLIPTTQMLPAIGQGIVVVQAPTNSPWLPYLSVLHDVASATRAQAERSLGRALGSNCQVPVGGFAEFTAQGQLWLRGMLGDAHGVHLAEATAPLDQAAALGLEVAQQLRQQSAAVGSTT